MKTIKYFSILQFLFISMLCIGCRRSSDEVWDDTKTGGRHMSRGVRSAAGKHGDSRQVKSKNEFLGINDEYCAESLEFEPYADHDYDEIAMADPNIKRSGTSQARQEPGMPSSNIPGIDGFRNPKENPETARIFQNIYFSYNNSMIKGKENLEVVRAIANYMRARPDMYLFVEGHCDERGAEAYNLALGSRRSNSVRNLLIQEGVNPENIFTVSYGKEKPIAMGHDEDAWGKNRRAEFKTYER